MIKPYPLTLIDPSKRLKNTTKTDFGVCVCFFSDPDVLEVQHPSFTGP